MKRIRALFESIVFSGLKPGAPPAQPNAEKWYAPLLAVWDRILSGGEQRDPLYLTNRTLGQKIRLWLMVAVPCLLVIGFVAIMLSRNIFYDPPDAPAHKEMSAEEVSRKILPNIAKNIQIETNHDVEVVEVHVDQTHPMKVSGSIRNNTASTVTAVDIIINLTDSIGSQLGAVNGRVENLPPKAVKTFEFPIEQRNAAVALVREVNPVR